jgi:hypothetical protein
VLFDDWFPTYLEKALKKVKEKLMSNNHENRVLTRRGARQLTSDELEQITAAGGPFTRASLTGTGTMLSTDSDMDS